MFDTVFGIKVRMSGLCINWYRPIVRPPFIGRPIIGHCLIGASLVCSAVVNNGLDTCIAGPLWPTKYWKNTTAWLQHKPQMSQCTNRMPQTCWNCLTGMVLINGDFWVRQRLFDSFRNFKSWPTIWFATKNTICTALIQLMEIFKYILMFVVVSLLILTRLSLDAEAV